MTLRERQSEFARTEIKIRLNCETKVEGKKIMQRISLPGFLRDESPKGHELATRVCDTAEKGVREALIKLGWTPPKNECP
jgi:hypothetical protein